MDNLKITVSSAFNGRDLALIKALINLKNQYDDVTFEYKDDSKTSQLLIIKDYLDDGSIFYGLNQVSGARIAIEPDLNPNSLRQMFANVARDPEEFCAQKQPLEKPESVAELIMQQVNQRTSNLFQFKTLNFDLIFNLTDGIIWAESKISHENISEISHGSLKDVKIDRQIMEKSKQHSYSYCLTLFLWRMGFGESQNLILHNVQKEFTLFKQISWPNYGKLDFKNDFILLSAKLWKSSHSYDDLCSRSGVDKKIVNQFLNANLMAGYVSAIAGENKEQPEKLKTASRFIKGLRRLFTKK